MLHIGSVPYANARPLLEGLDGDANVRLTLAPPAILADRLAAGDLDIALVPSVEYFRRPGSVLVPEGCIASRGAVASVALFHRAAAIPAGARVLVDASSRTSAALLRVLCAGPLGIAGATFASCPPETDPAAADGDAVLLIGDRALTLDRAGLHETDLGEAWTQWTGLPFVWAVWVARDEGIAAEAVPLLRRARSRGAENLSAVVWREAGRLGIQEAVMGRYLTRHIRHELGEEERAGLRRFGEECRALALLP